MIKIKRKYRGEKLDREIGRIFRPSSIKLLAHTKVGSLASKCIYKVLEFNFVVKK